MSVFAQAAQDQEKTSGSTQILPGGPGHTAQESVDVLSYIVEIRASGLSLNAMNHSKGRSFRLKNADFK
jgi:hypothetical protein